MYEQILNNYCMGLISARETAAKLIEAGFPEDMQTVQNEKLRENMYRIRIEERSFDPAVDEIAEILEVANHDREICVRQYCKEGILVKEFSVTLYSPWTDAHKGFKFDNYCAVDNNANLIAFKKFIEEN